MKKGIPLFAVITATLVCGCASKPSDAQQACATAAGADFGVRYDDRREALQHRYLTTGEARSWDEAEELTAAEMNREWADAECAAAEEKRQEKIQESLRNAKLDDDF